LNNSKNIAFIGCGLMAAPMARNLLKSGFGLSMWNRTSSKLTSFAEIGATVCQTPAQAVSGARTVLLMLSDTAAVDEVLYCSGMMGCLAPGTVVIDFSSIETEAARHNADRLKTGNISYLDAPVSGGTTGARERTLAIFVGGSEPAFKQVLPVFDVLGTARYMGGAGSGQITKLANQIIVAITIGAVAEGLLFASAAGVDPHRVRKALRGGFADSKIMDLHGARMLKRDFTPGGPNRIFLKDVETAAASVESLALELPQFARALLMFRTLIADGKSEHDHSSLLLALEGLNPQYRLTDADDVAPSEIEKV
jgi:2-hydroxy-3-oxopropionate reductase